MKTVPQCVRLQEESFVFTFLFSASLPRLSPRPLAAVQALPLVRPQRRAPEPRDGRPPRPLLPLGTKRPQDREFAGGGDISPPSCLSPAPRPSRGFQGRAWGSGRCGDPGGGTPVMRDTGRGPGGLFPRGKTSAAPKVRPPLAHGSRRLHQNPRRQKPPQRGSHCFPSLSQEADNLPRSSL